MSRWLLARRRVIFLLAFLIIVLVGLGAAALPTELASETSQARTRDLRLRLAPTAKALSSVVRGSFLDDRVYLEDEGETVSFDSQGLRIAATLYRPKGEGKRPGILLLHGSTPEGRKLGLYRVLGRELAARGYVVLSTDHRGFGESEDPPRTDIPAALDFVGDARVAVAYLASLDGVDTRRLYMLGHSFGGDVALTAGIDEPRVRKIVVIGPTRRHYERIATELPYFQQRAVAYMQLSQPIPRDVYLQVIESMLIDNHADCFSLPGHKPLLLVDGALEDADDRRFLREIYDHMGPPKRLVTLPDADHYANVANFGPLVVFDQRAVERLVSEIDSWLSEL